METRTNTLVKWTLLLTLVGSPATVLANDELTPRTGLGLLQQWEQRQHVPSYYSPFSVPFLSDDEERALVANGLLEEVQGEPNWSGRAIGFPSVRYLRKTPKGRELLGRYPFLAPGEHRPREGTTWRDLDALLKMRK